MKAPQPLVTQCDNASTYCYIVLRVYPQIKSVHAIKKYKYYVGNAFKIFFMRLDNIVIILCKNAFGRPTQSGKKSENIYIHIFKWLQKNKKNVGIYREILKLYLLQNVNIFGVYENVNNKKHNYRIGHIYTFPYLASIDFMLGAQKHGLSNRIIIFCRKMHYNNLNA